MTKKKTIRAVLDTNVLVSALLFGGESSRLVSLWQKGRFVYLTCRPILDEYLRVLAYPKFQLTDHEIKQLIHEELLPYLEVIEGEERTAPPWTWRLKDHLKDQDDEKFLEAAVAGKADYLVTGDQELLTWKGIKDFQVVPPADFARLLIGEGDNPG